MPTHDHESHATRDGAPEQTPLERAVELRRQAEAMCAERGRERDAMERRALASEAALARVREEFAAERAKLLWHVREDAASALRRVLERVRAMLPEGG
jgi:hypothetical protein